MIQILCVHHITWSLSQKPEGGGLLMATEFDAKTIQMRTTVLITSRLRRELPGTVRDHLYMGNFYFQTVMSAHKAVLEEYGYWKHIVKKWDEVIRTGTLKFNQQYVYFKMAAIFDKYKLIQS